MAGGCESSSCLVCDDERKGEKTTEKQFNFLYCPKDEEVGINEIELVTEKQDDPGTTRRRKRKCNPDAWKVKHVKKPGLRKNSPLVALTATMTCCKKKCLQNISVSHLTKLRYTFQTLLYDEQNIYLNGLLHRHETVRSSGHPRKDNPVTSSGKRLGRPPAEYSRFSFDYTLVNEKGINVRVCQKAFCTVHGFGPKRLQVLRQKIENGRLELDRRGKHDNHSTIDNEVKDLIREHIKSLPSRQSHYSRKDNPQRIYLSPELSIARLHYKFLEKYDPEYIQLKEEHQKCVIAHKEPPKLRKPLVSEHLYHDIFVNEFNIHFGYPRTDTYSTCDKLMIQTDAATGSERQQIQEALEAHQLLAQEGYQTFRHDKELSRKTWNHCK